MINKLLKAFGLGFLLSMVSVMSFAIPKFGTVYVINNTHTNFDIRYMGIQPSVPYQPVRKACNILIKNLGYHQDYTHVILPGDICYFGSGDKPTNPPVAQFMVYPVNTNNTVCNVIGDDITRTPNLLHIIYKNGANPDEGYLCKLNS